MPSALRTGGTALGFLCAALLASPILLPAYREAVRVTAGEVLPAVVPGVAVARDGDAGWRVYRLEPDGTETKVLRIPMTSLTQLYVGVIFLLPLLAMTPVAAGRRLRLAGFGVLLLLFLQAGLLVLFLTAWVHFQRTTPDSSAYAWLTILHSTAGQWAALPLWAGLTWRHWFGTSVAPARR